MNGPMTVAAAAMLALVGCAGREAGTRGDGGEELPVVESFVAPREVCVMVPVDDETWTRAKTDELEDRGPAAEVVVTFVQRLVSRRPGVSDDRVAVEWILARYAPGSWEIAKLERRGSTVVLVLNVDEDGYAGVTRQKRFVLPIIERTLLCQPGVRKAILWRP